MNNLIGKILVAALIAFITTACSSTLGYMKNSGDPASPRDKEFVFSLRNSSILISKIEKTPNNSTQPASKKENPPNKSAQPVDQILATNNCPQPKGGEKGPTGDDVLNKCLLSVSAQAAAARDKSAFYVARRGIGTTVTSTTAVDADPFMIKSITLNYKNPAIGIVTSAGAGAAAGFGVGGPMGAVVFGLFEAGGAVIAAAGAAPVKGKEPVEWAKKNVCKEDWQTDVARFAKLKSASEQPPQLFLPIVIDYKNGSSLSPCWHPLPNSSGEAVKAAMLNPKDPPPLSGWFYHIVEGKSTSESNNSNLPPVLPTDLGKLYAPFQTREEYFSNTEQQETFPVSACRSVEVQITWWEMLNTNGNQVRYYKYPVTVADFNYVQAVHLPKNGSVYLLPVCGGYASSTQSSSSIGDVIDAIVKQVQAVKDAQTKYEKSQ